MSLASGKRQAEAEPEADEAEGDLRKSPRMLGSPAREDSEASSSADEGEEEDEGEGVGSPQKLIRCDV